MMEGNRSSFEQIGPLVQRLEQGLAEAEGRDAIRGASVALADYLARPGIREWLAGGIPIDEGSIRPLWIDPGARFSILLYQWQPGAVTSIHDHWCWGTVAVIVGVEEEAQYALAGPGLARQTSTHLLRPGEVTSFPAGPDGIHRVAGAGATSARSLHIYGGDVSQTGFSSIDRVYQEASAGVTPAVAALR